MLQTLLTTQRPIGKTKIHTPNLDMGWLWSNRDSDKPSEPAKESPPASATIGDVARKAIGEPESKKLPEREKLPRDLQKIIEKEDKEENRFDELVEG